MPVLIKGINISPNTLNVGSEFTVTVLAEESTWNSVKTELQTWGDVRRSFTNWNRVKDFIYIIPNPMPDGDCVYSYDRFALFDVDAVQISINGGATLNYSAEDINQFIMEVKNG